MVNVNKLKGKIIEKGKSVDCIAREIGIDKSTLYRKLSLFGEQITIKEADVIVKVLELNKDEAVSIFFAQYVA